MKKIKKTTLLLLALIGSVCLGVGLTACKSKKGPDVGKEESSVIDLTGEKEIVCGFEETVGVYSTIDVNKCYGICNGLKFACKATVTEPDGNTVEADSKYTFTKSGKYTIKLTSVIGEETVEKTVTVTTDGYSAQGLFTCSNATYLQDKKAVAENLNTEYRSGVQFQLEASNSKVQFNPVIDLNDLKGESLSSLVEFTTNVNSTNLPDLRGVRVVLTDVYDSSNSIAVSFSMSSTILWLDRNAGIEEFTAAAPSLKAEWNGYAIGDSSLYPPEPGITYAFSSSFMPQYHLPSSKPSAFDPMTVYFDNTENAVYTAKNIFVYDLDEPTDKYSDFKGFTTGEVYVSIESTGTNGDLVITKIGNYTFDDVQESAYANANSTMLFNGYDFDNMLNGVVGYSYPLPEILYADEVSAKLYKVNGETETEIAFNGEFKPSEAGRYAIKYTSKNEYGYDTSIKGYFEVLSSPVEIDAPSVELSAKLLDVWKVPELSFGGGIGELSLQYSLKKGDKTYTVKPSDAFAIDKKGEAVALVVKATDSVGYSRTVEFPVTVDCDVMRFALVDSFDSITVCAGSTVKVPDYVAIDYSQEDVSGNNVDITIRRGKTQTLSVGDEIEVQSDSNIYYYAGETLLKTFSIRCLENFVEGVDVSTQFTSSEGIEKIATLTLGTAFTLSGEAATVKMPYALASSGLEVEFSLFDDMLSGSVLVRLLSASGEELRYELKNLGAKPTLWVNGEKTFWNVSAKKGVYKEPDLPEYYNREYYTYSFIVDGAKSAFYNGDSLKIGSIDKWNSGLAYDGFEKGAAQVLFEVNGKANGVFILGEVSNQGFTSVHLRKGEKVAPMIAFEGSFGSTSVAKGSTVTVPMAYAYDVFDAASTVFMSVSTPSGNYLKKKITAQEYSFKADEYGIYYVSYDVKDSKGNRNTLNYLIVVSDDVPPVLTVSGSYAETYKEKVTILSATATDNVNGELSVTVWIEKKDMTTREVQMGETVALEAGKYKIVYYAMDKKGNFAVERFEITVE